MKYKEFVKWCNDRACDGCWSMDVASYCIWLVSTINELPFWKREKVWKNDYEDKVVNEITIPINKKIEECKTGVNRLWIKN